jgi:hypothetical protein
MEDRRSDVTPGRVGSNVSIAGIGKEVTSSGVIAYVVLRLISIISDVAQDELTRIARMVPFGTALPQKPTAALLSGTLYPI